MNLSKKYNIVLLVLCLCLVAGALSIFMPWETCADDTSTSNACTTAGSDTAGSCNECISSVLFTNAASGDQIISAMFTAINNVMGSVEQSFFNGIVGAQSFQQAIGTAFLLYIAMYGIMIMFGLGNHKTNEVVNRLIKVGIVYMLTGPGAWGTFNTWVGNPIIGGMNQIINEFMAVAEGGSAVTQLQMENGSDSFLGLGGNSGGLDPNAFNNMFGSSLTIVFSAQLFTAIIGMLTTGFFGWLVAIFLMWALIEFLKMMIGALITYAKAIIGLAFLFALAPLFFVFLLFEKSRPIFQAWLNQVLTFALQPVMLFAFLSFYLALINQAAPNLLKPGSGEATTDFCWSKWISVPGQLWDFYSWKPTTASGDYITQDWVKDGSGTVADSPISVPNVIYFLMLCNLGKSFTALISQLAGDIGGGTGPGIVRIDELTNGMKSVFNRIGGGGRGRGRGRGR